MWSSEYELCLFVEWNQQLQNANKRHMLKEYFSGSFVISIIDGIEN